MSDSPEQMDTTARSPLAGCAILIVALLVMVFLVVFSVFTLFRQYKEIVKFTDDKPAKVELTTLDGQETKINDLSERLEHFRQVLAEEEEARIAFSAEDINLAIAAYEPFVELRETFHVESMDEKGMRIRISFPLNGVPRLSKDDEEGLLTTDPRYLNAVLVARPMLLKGEVILKLNDIEVEKAKVPTEFIEQMSPYRPAERYNVDEVIGPIMRQLTRVVIEGDQVVLLRIPGQTPADKITDEQVDAAGSRFFLIFGGACCLFLVFAGTMIFIGLRAKGRRDDA